MARCTGDQPADAELRARLAPLPSAASALYRWAKVALVCFTRCVREPQSLSNPHLT